MKPDGNTPIVLTYSTFIKGFLAVLSIAALVADIWGIPQLLNSDQQGWKLILFLLLIAAGNAIIFLGLIDAFKCRLELSSQGAIYVGVFRTKKLTLDQIEGYSEEEKYVRIRANQKGLKNIAVPTYLQPSYMLHTWFARNDIANLDELEFEEEQEDILSNPEFGDTEAERNIQLLQAKKWAKYLNYAGWGYGAWALFYSKPYDLVIWLGILLTLTCYGVVINFKGLIRVNQYDNSAYPSVYAGALVPGVVLFVRCLMDFEIYDYSPLWPSLIALGIALAVFMLWSTRSINIKDLTDLMAYVGSLVYGHAFAFAIIVSINCYYDSHAQGATYATEVIDLHTSGSKHTSYHVTFAPTGPFPDGDDVTVSRSTYEEVQIGDEMILEMKDGLLGIPWYDFQIYVQD
ncbi:hypothetical protein KFE98_05850 [bacterium SCSIO 12741]|nr:hypothetical protein KFE98_05850 [bacterium SCSIO 12741]